MDVLIKMAKLIIDGVEHSFKGKNLKIRRNISIDGNVIIADTENIKNPVKLVTEGNILNIDTVGDVEVSGNVQGRINTTGDVMVKGDVGGSIDTTGDVTSGKVGGNINTVGDVSIN